MGEVTVYARMVVTGPIADGTASDAVNEWLDKSKRDLADEGMAMLQGFVMDKTGRGTGHYQSELQATILTRNDILLHDPVVYGPWLEGVSERNRSTRFKGYHLWRLTRQRLDDRAVQVAEDNWPYFADRIGGKP